ncbi:hypothetical protein HY025_01255 [Candidatus Daviesbacteria bacterium]|nr:hypothetical protein [Candidatus Daviesbacteria bacterium]
MNIPTHSQKNKRGLYKDKPDEREIWYKIVVKIIRWKETLAKNNQNALEKITPKEWKIYYKGTIKHNSLEDKKKALKLLKETQKVIAEVGGFTD